MKAADPSARPSSSDDSFVESLLFDLLDRPEAERVTALEDACRRHPEQAATLRRRLALLATELPQAMHDEAPPNFGRFRLCERLGGGMVDVFLAIDTANDTQVVLKVMRHPQLLTAPVQDSFARELLAASRLQHPGIGPVLEVDRHDGTPYLVQPYVEGITLAQWIRRRRAAGHAPGRADVELVLGWLEGVLRALHVAHAQGLVHRDVKPSNILLPFHGVPRVLDFGLCHEAAGTPTTPGTPTPGAGTLAYMAPELLQGTRTTVGPASDVYAAGVTLFEAITLRLPFTGANEQALCRAILQQEPPDVGWFGRHLTDGLQRVVAAALARHPRGRYATAAAFADDLARLRAGEPVLAPRLSWRRRCLRWCARQRAGAVAAAALAAVGLTWAVVAASTGHAGTRTTAAWDAAIRAVAASPHYGGLRLTVQPDLVPLGPDPRSGLHEFLHPASGWQGPPVQRDERGRLQLHDGAGIVFVLIPGGRCLIGEQRLDPTAPRYDPDAAYYAPPYEAVLAPFLLSKFEMTKAQWLRLTGDDPSTFRLGDRPYGDPAVTLRHPVESVSALTCDAVLAAAGLELPTEAQWEYAAGANAPTRWFFGDDPAQLVRYGNVDDRRFLAARHPIQPTRDFDDGYAGLAPVGSFDANVFGLHDVVGNVAEWCRDECDDYRASEPAAGDGMRRPVRADPMRSIRGSRYWQSIHKTSSRPGLPPDRRDDGLGLRPARNLRGGGR